MRHLLIAIAAVVSCCWPSALPRAAAEKPGLTNPFFAFDNGTGRGKLSPGEQAKMLKDLGYAGIGYTGTKGIPEMLEALDQHGLKMFSIYVGASIGSNGPKYDQNIKQAVKDLKGRDTIIWLFITGRMPDGDDGDKQAVEVVRQVADLAEESGLRVVLYPHHGFYVDRVEDGLRIVKQAQRKNVGTSLNLCHWIRSGDKTSIEKRIEELGKHLFLVSINGADNEGGWNRLIRTLDQGEYDVYNFLGALTESGYSGPIGLQCYGVRGEPRENLKRSITAWQGFSAKMAGERKK